MVVLSTFRWTARLSARTLRHLAAIADRQERREFIDPERAAQELAEMICRNDQPTIGWYRRNLAPKPPPEQRP